MWLDGHFHKLSIRFTVNYIVLLFKKRFDFYIIRSIINTVTLLVIFNDIFVIHTVYFSNYFYEQANNPTSNVREHVTKSENFIITRSLSKLRLNLLSLKTSPRIIT